MLNARTEITKASSFVFQDDAAVAIRLKGGDDMNKR
jgi:hypothetical protein